MTDQLGIILKKQWWLYIVHEQGVIVIPYGYEQLLYENLYW